MPASAHSKIAKERRRAIRQRRKEKMSNMTEGSSRGRWRRRSEGSGEDVEEEKSLQREHGWSRQSKWYRIERRDSYTKNDEEKTHIFRRYLRFNFGQRDGTQRHLILRYQILRVHQLGSASSRNLALSIEQRGWRQMRKRWKRTGGEKEQGRKGVVKRRNEEKGGNRKGAYYLSQSDNILSSYQQYACASSALALREKVLLQGLKRYKLVPAPVKRGK